MSEHFYRSELDNRRKPEADPKTWAGATRQCGKCGSRVPIRGSTGSKVHRMWGWMCAPCSTNNNN